MSLTRVAAALAVAGAVVVPASAQAIVQYCTPHTSVGYVCHAPEQPGCVHGAVGMRAFATTFCG